MAGATGVADILSVAGPSHRRGAACGAVHSGHGSPLPAPHGRPRGRRACSPTTRWPSLIGMVLDQQIPLEWAFRSPAELARRLGGPSTPRRSPPWTPTSWPRPFAPSRPSTATPGRWPPGSRPCAGRWPRSTAGDAAAVWKGAADGTELRRRLEALPGFGHQKARIFVALLGKQLGVDPPGWREASAPFGEPGSCFSVADIVDAASLDRVRAHKQQMKAAAKAAGAKKAGRRQPTGGQRQEGGRPRPAAPPAVEPVAGRPPPLPLHARPPRPRAVRGGLRARRGRRGPAAGQGPRGPARCSPGPAPLGRVCADLGVPVHPQRPARPGPRGRGRRRARRPGRRPAGAGPAHPGPRGHRRPLHPLARTTSTRPLDEPVDYLSAGPVVATPTKPGRPGTGDGLRRPWPRRRAAVPVFVTGGVTPDRWAPLAAAGVRHFVVVRWLTEAADPEAAARALRPSHRRGALAAIRPETATADGRQRWRSIHPTRVATTRGSARSQWPAPGTIRSSTGPSAAASARARAAAAAPRRPRSRARPGGAARRRAAAASRGRSATSPAAQPATSAGNPGWRWPRCGRHAAATAAGSADPGRRGRPARPTPPPRPPGLRRAPAAAPGPRRGRSRPARPARPGRPAGRPEGRGPPASRRPRSRPPSRRRPAGMPPPPDPVSGPAVGQGREGPPGVGGAATVRGAARGRARAAARWAAPDRRAPRARAQRPPAGASTSRPRARSTGPRSRPDRPAPVRCRCAGPAARGGRRGRRRAARRTWPA